MEQSELIEATYAALEAIGGDDRFRLVTSEGGVYVRPVREAMNARDKLAALATVLYHRAGLATTPCYFDETDAEPSEWRPHYALRVVTSFPEDPTTAYDRHMQRNRAERPAGLPPE